MTIKKGSLIQRTRPYDGTSRAGRAFGPVLLVTYLGPPEGFQAIVWLHDGTWEFIWNLYEVELCRKK